MPKVAVIRCESYNLKDVKLAVQQGLDLLGGIYQFAQKGEKILLKPNLITGTKPEKSTTTHPQVFEAIASILIQNGINISAGDGPGVIYSLSAAKTSGLIDVAERLNFKWHDFKETIRTEFRGIEFRVFNIANEILKNDGIISLPKFKTHEFTTITGCVKNQYGCLSFSDKRKFHALYPDVYDFSSLLLDLNKFINPRLYIIDGISAMEGAGPLAGNSVKLNTLILSDDPIAADAVMCRIIELNPEYVATVKVGNDFGYGSYKNIILLGNDIKEFINPEFNVNRKKPLQLDRKGEIKGFAGMLIKKPVVISKNCTLCGDCNKACPVNPKAIYFEDNNKSLPPIIDYSKCIRCFCCFELCQFKAIKLNNPVSKRIIDQFIKIKS